MILPWLRIGLVVAVYLLTAVAASVLVRASGVDLKDFRSRTAPIVVAVGATANLLVLAVTLLFLMFVDHRGVRALGLQFGTRDLVFSVVALLVTASAAVAFLWLLKRWGVREVRPRRYDGGAEAKRFALTAVVLLVVALQEEVLFRGYVTLNLLALGPGVVLVVTTVLFTVIHFLTNRVTPAQVCGWLLGGFVLGWVYLASGTIWVPVLLHFAMDLTNVVAFDIAGDMALAAISPPMSVRQRAAYRAVFTAAVVVLGMAFYGRGFAARWYRATLHPRPGEVEARAEGACEPTHHAGAGLCAYPS
ncbi:MAG: type II CAAX endopeptidase family protein [Gemmatimonadota bacterium]